MPTGSDKSAARAREKVHLGGLGGPGGQHLRGRRSRGQRTGGEERLVRLPRGPVAPWQPLR
jgi:hypothetical protein